MSDLCKLYRPYYEIDVTFDGDYNISVIDGCDTFTLSIEELEKILFLAKLRKYTEKEGG